MRGATGLKYVTFRGGLRRAIPFLLVRSACTTQDFSNADERSVLPANCVREGWKSGKTITVLLTGGSGNLGQLLVPKLLDKDNTPVILDVRTPPHLNRKAESSRAAFWTARNSTG